MKRYLILVLACLTIISCKEEKKQSKEDIIQENITNQLKPTFKNPDSFEFVEMDLESKETVGERKKITNKEQVERIKDLYDKSGSKDAKDLLDSVQKELEFLNNQSDDNKTAIFKYNFKVKGTNSFGGTIQSKYQARVLNDNNYTILSISRNN